ncbi:unnamed protein product, partial [Rotaria magnacalcarata]
QQQQQQQPQVDKVSNHSTSMTSPMGQSPERLLRPTNEKYDFGAGDPMMNRRSPSTLSMQSSASDEPNELILINQVNNIFCFHFLTSVPHSHW